LIVLAVEVLVLELEALVLELEELVLDQTTLGPVAVLPVWSIKHVITFLWKR
jgi:hypothetical protein